MYLCWKRFVIVNILSALFVFVNCKLIEIFAGCAHEHKIFAGCAHEHKTSTKICAKACSCVLVALLSAPLWCLGRQLAVCSFTRYLLLRFMRYCQASNLFIDFKRLSTSGNNKYREDLFQSGDIGGFCRLDKDVLKAQSEHKSPLQSW